MMIDIDFTELASIKDELAPLFKTWREFCEKFNLGSKEELTAYHNYMGRAENIAIEKGWQVSELLNIVYLYISPTEENN